MDGDNLLASLKPGAVVQGVVFPEPVEIVSGPKQAAAGVAPAAPTGGATSAAVDSSSGFAWEGEIPTQKWMNFYTKVVSRFATGTGVKLTLRLEVAPQGGVPASKIDEARAALRELGLRDALKLKSLGVVGCG